MWVDRKPFIYLWRPLYRGVVVGLILPLMSRVKVALFAGDFEQLRESIKASDRRMGVVAGSLQEHLVEMGNCLVGLASKNSGDLEEIRRATLSITTGLTGLAAKGSMEIDRLTNGVRSMSAETAECLSALGREVRAVNQRLNATEAETAECLSALVTEIRVLNQRLNATETETAECLSALGREVRAVNQRLNATEAETAQRWHGMETLILSILSETVSRENRIG